MRTLLVLLAVCACLAVALAASLGEARKKSTDMTSASGKKIEMKAPQEFMKQYNLKRERHFLQAAKLNNEKKGELMMKRMHSLSKKREMSEQIFSPVHAGVEECPYPSQSFWCPSGGVHWGAKDCIPKEWVCDGLSNCNNGEDEQGCPPPPDECAANEFRCAGNSPHGYCINLDELGYNPRCDGSHDCYDGADEKDCNAETCASEGLFSCPNGLVNTYDSSHKCIPAEWQCNGVPDCNGGYDEQGCTPPDECAANEFRCAGNSPHGYCINLDELGFNPRCDGSHDCYDGADEKDCNAETCASEGLFSCPNGLANTYDSSHKCIPAEWQCNGVPDCNGGYDEQGCTPPDECAANEFRCAGNSPYGYCINLDELGDYQPRCNGFEDCYDGADEEDCKTVTVVECPSPSFLCPTGVTHWDDGNCIPQYWVCDGRSDCNNGEDEQGCPPTSKLTKAKTAELHRRLLDKLSKH